MRICKAVILALLGFVLAGCRNDPTIAYLERDNNQKELQINDLKYRVAELEEQLGAAAPAQRGFTRPAAPAVLDSAPGFTKPGPALLPSGRAPDEPALPGTGPLNISPGMETPSGAIPDTLRSPGRSAPGRIPPPGGSSRWTPADVRLASGATAVDIQSVAQITLHPSLTGGIGSGTAGDEGLLVVVEPRDFAGTIVPLARDTSVALIDPALPGEQARLARWDFSAAQIERMVHTGSEPGIHLRLKWRFPPSHDRLTVVVRYKTRDGKWLEARQVIAVATGEGSSRPDVAEQRPDGRDPRETIKPRPDGPERPQWSPDRD